MKEKIEKAFQDLGATSQEVYDKLISLQIKGDHDGLTCPVAKYLCKEIASTGFVVVPSETIAFDQELKERVIVRNPDAIKEFILDFDSGKYPGLYEIAIHL